MRYPIIFLFIFFMGFQREKNIGNLFYYFRSKTCHSVFTVLNERKTLRAFQSQITLKITYQTYLIHTSYTSTAISQNVMSSWEFFNNMMEIELHNWSEYIKRFYNLYTIYIFIT